MKSIDADIQYVDFSISQLPVALTRLRHIISLAILAAALPRPASVVSALEARDPLPGLDSFTTSLIDGQADVLRGVYIPGVLANAVVQQPEGYPDFVSADRDLLTHFDQASQLGSTGILAHNFLAGSRFSEILPGQMIYLIYGDGRTSAYVVREILRYQALQPASTYSEFIDLTNGRQLDTAELFAAIYGRRGALILQTCIEYQGLSTWGRLFLVAEPVYRRGFLQ